jgi:2-oxoglutarate/2-oxoacid ferredoxin oxidoreductase subunit alpha
MNIEIANQPKSLDRETLESAVVRFAGDSGDGMQITGGQFTLATALAGNDLATFPDFPAEIRAPIGTTFGVSSFQINFGARQILTSGDEIDVLVAMNPAALKVNVTDLRKGGLIIADETAFQDRNLAKAGYSANPLEDHSLSAFHVLKIPVTDLTLAAIKTLDNVDVTNKESVRAKNMWALGLVLWLFDREKKPASDWIKVKFGKLGDIAVINGVALDAGYAYGDVSEMDIHPYRVPAAKIPPGHYRGVTGIESLCWGLTAGANFAERNLVYCSYPITPASNILHMLTRLGADYNVTTFQAEDEIAAACAAIGASYGGKIGITGSSGPGIALKTEAIGLAAATELPLVIVNVQRGGPSTGLPTKTEQSDLFQSVWGRNADTPLVVLSTNTPGHCFETAIEAVRIATKYMTPVILLMDGYLANASEPWPIPDIDGFAFEPVSTELPGDFEPYRRDPDTLARPWVAPGTPGGAHRIGGIERQDITGEISYDAENHDRMTHLRAKKISQIANDIPPQTVDQGNQSGALAVVSWGSVYGPASRAVETLIEEGIDASHIQISNIWPLPANLGELLSGFEQVLVPEMNMGQLSTLLKSEFHANITSQPKISGRPFKVAEIVDAAKEIVERAGK